MKSYKTKVIFIVACLLLPFGMFGKNFKVNFNYLAFSTSTGISYIEFQFLFRGNELTYAPVSENSYQALIGVDISFQNADTLITRNYNFTGEEYPDSLSAEKNNVYNVVRVPLPDGTYNMKILLYDKNASRGDSLRHNDVITIDFQRDNMVNISDILPVGFFKKAEQDDNFSRHGVEYMPYLSDLYTENIDRLTFMAEIYNTDVISVGRDFVVHSYIARYDENTPLTPKYEKWEAGKKSDMHVVFQSFDIDSLPSGNYNLKIDVLDRKDTLHAYKSWFFRRDNPSIPPVRRMRKDSISYDTMKLYLDYIRIIANEEEVDFIDNISPDKYHRIEKFFNTFWEARNPELPQQEWYKYYAQVVRANNNYSTLKNKGYKTDRGHYYLKYGPPNEIRYEHSEVNAYPYEVWTYDKLSTGQANVIFVFYNRDLTTKDFKLLHSTARGEFSNPQWKEILHIEGVGPANPIELQNK
jgi:GWxTD domain-containing protein